MVPSRDGRRPAHVSPDSMPALDLVARECALEPDLGRDLGDEAGLAAAAGGADHVAVDEATVDLGEHFRLVDFGAGAGGVEDFEFADGKLRRQGGSG